MENLKVEKGSVEEDSFFIALQWFYNMLRHLREL